jgi:hypothetical protein
MLPKRWRVSISGRQLLARLELERPRVANLIAAQRRAHRLFSVVPFQQSIAWDERPDPWYCTSSPSGVSFTGGFDHVPHSDHSRGRSGR